MAGSSGARCGLATAIARRGLALGHPRQPQGSPTPPHGKERPLKASIRKSRKVQTLIKAEKTGHAQSPRKSPSAGNSQTRSEWLRPRSVVAEPASVEPGRELDASFGALYAKASSLRPAGHD